MPKLSDLIQKGVMPDLRGKGPEYFEGKGPLNIQMDSLKLTHGMNNRSNTEQAGFECDVTVQADGTRHHFISQSQALTQQVRDQFLPFADEIGDTLEVEVVSETSRKEPGRKVYHFK